MNRITAHILAALALALATCAGAGAKSVTHHHHHGQGARAQAEPTPAAPVPHVVSYTQSPGFGGPLTVDLGSGPVTSFFGEKAVLECSSDGGATFAACTKERLVAGTRVASAEHAVNPFGHDVWTHVALIVSGPPSSGAR